MPTLTSSPVTDPRAADPVIDDAALLAAVADGDSRALAELYRRHAPLLLLRLRRRCADEGLAQEVLQDVFLAAWRSAGRWTGSGPVAAWLWGIAVRRLADARRRTPAATAAFDALLHEPAPAPSAEEQVVDAVAWGPLGTALDRLAPPLRAVVQVTVLDGRTTVEAAAVLGIPVGTVKTRSARARAQLRRDLADLGLTRSATPHLTGRLS